MKDYKDKLGGLANKLRQEQPKTPIQEVHPVKVIAPVNGGEAQLNTWIPKTLLKRMKVYGVNHDISLKDINIQALEFFLDHKSKPK